MSRVPGFRPSSSVSILSPWLVLSSHGALQSIHMQWLTGPAQLSPSLWLSHKIQTHSYSCLHTLLWVIKTSQTQHFQTQFLILTPSYLPPLPPATSYFIHSFPILGDGKSILQVCCLQTWTKGTLHGAPYLEGPRTNTHTHITFSRTCVIQGFDLVG